MRMLPTPARLVLTLAAALAGCGDGDRPATTKDGTRADAAPAVGAQVSAPLATGGPAVLQGPAGEPASADALAPYATQDDLTTAATSYVGKLSWDEAAGLLKHEDLPSQAALDELLSQADLATIDAAVSEEEADALLVPKELVPDPALLLTKEEAAKTFVLAATAPDWSAYVMKQDLPPVDTWLTQEQVDAQFPSTAEVTADHYAQAAAGQKFQSAFEPLSPTLVAQVEAAVDAALASRPCPGDMVAAGDVCVDRVEASVWAEPDCSGAQYGVGADDYPPSFPDTGATGGLPLYACSVAGVRPSASLTWFQAQQACAASDKRLCTLAEWQVAAAGSPDDAASCHLDAFVVDASVIDAATACVSTWGAVDMVGNVAEWTASVRVAGKKWQQSQADQKPWPAGFGDGADQTFGLNGYGAMEEPDGNFVKGAPVAVVRGGSWLDGASAGVYAMDWTRSPADASATVGFRCCVSR